MDALILEQVGEWRLEELRREALHTHDVREARRAAGAARRRRAGDDDALIRIADGPAVAHDGNEIGRLATRTTTMLQDPFMLTELGSQRLEALRREAQMRNDIQPPVARWRRTAGYSLVRVGLRVLRHPAPAEVLERAAL